MKGSQFGNITYENEEEKAARGGLVNYLKQCPIPDDEVLSNLGLFLDSKHLSRILFMDHLYQQIVDVPGIIIEFGLRWGQNTALFASLRGIYDPFNRHRKIVGFDTFKGFPTISKQDGSSVLMEKGKLAVSERYKDYLSGLMELHEKSNPLHHIRKFELIEGDATVEIDAYLKNHPETIVALAYFDFDVYEPTKKCLEAIRPHLTKGSVIGFDELNDPDSPGETVALMETIGLNNIRLLRHRFTSRVSYFVME